MTTDQPTQSARRPGVVPYITLWSEEVRALPSPLVLRRDRRGGIAYADEVPADRDGHGVLWQRRPYAPGRGRPLWKEVHCHRQRRAMQRLLCQVCGGPADRDERGVLWVVGAVRDGKGGSPEGEDSAQPPVCLPCAHVAVRACRHLRPGFLAVRVARPWLVGVHGTYHRAVGPWAEAWTHGSFGYGDPRVRWVQAAQLLRRMEGCTQVDLATERPGRPATAP